MNGELTEAEREALEAVTGNHALLNSDGACVSCHTARAVKRVLHRRIAELEARALRIDRVTGRPATIYTPPEHVVALREDAEHEGGGGS